MTSSSATGGCGPLKPLVGDAIVGDIDSVLDSCSINLFPRACALMKVLVAMPMANACDADMVEHMCNGQQHWGGGEVGGISPIN